VTQRDSAGEIEIQQRTFRFRKEHSYSEVTVRIRHSEAKDSGSAVMPRMSTVCSTSFDAQRVLKE
jgi:hypothetical protein